VHIAVNISDAHKTAALQKRVPKIVSDNFSLILQMIITAKMMSTGQEGHFLTTIYQTTILNAVVTTYVPDETR